MLSYLEFIFESKSEGRVEIPLYLSFELREILKSIALSKADGYRIALHLISCNKNIEIGSDVSYIDVTDVNDKLSFIQANRVRKFYDESDKNVEFEDWIYNKWYDQELKKKGDVWTKQRSEISVGKLTNRICKITNKEITPSELEKFVNIYKAAFDRTKDAFSRFELVSGEEIKKWYLYTNYESNTGQLGSSCMRHSSCQDYLNIYTENPEVVSLLILKGLGDKITGRALIWKTMSGDILMDRIYTIKDSDKKLFEDYAESKGLKYTYDIVSDELNNYEIKLNKSDFEQYPYLDTFSLLNREKRILSSDEDLWPGQGYIKLQQTDGSYYSDDVVWSEYDGEYIDRSEAVFCVRSGEYISQDNAIFLEYKDEWAHPNSDDTVYSRYKNQYYYLEDAVYSEILNSWINIDEAIEIDLDMEQNKTDSIHIDFEKDIIEFEDGIKTIRFLTMKDPNSGEIGFKDSILRSIKNEYEEVSNEELYKYISELEIEIPEYDDKMAKQKIGLSMNVINKDLIKCLLITSPRKSEYSYNTLRYNLLNSECVNKIPITVLNQHTGFLSSNGLEKCLKYSNLLIDKIILDPKMLASYLKKKEIY